MGGGRLEVRLDDVRRRKLLELAERSGTSVSRAVRAMIDEAYEQTRRADRVAAARRIAELELEDVPDPGTLGQQLAGAHDTHLP